MAKISKYKKVSNIDKKQMMLATDENGATVNIPQEVLINFINKELLIGKLDISPKGEYIQGSVYSVLDAVSNEGSSYISLINDNVEPLENTEAWMVSAKKGDKGNPFVYEDFTPEQLQELHFRFEDFTPEQLQSLKVKGDKGDKGDTGYVEVFKYKGNVPTYSYLANIVDPQVNDGYGVVADGLVYVYNGEAFPPDGDGMDLHLRPNGKVEKENKLAVSGDEVYKSTILASDVQTELPLKYRFNESVDTTTGKYSANPNMASIDLLPINDSEEIIISRSENSGVSVVFYDSNKNYIGRVVPDDLPVQRVIPLPGSAYMSKVFSTSKNTRNADFLKFKVYQKNNPLQKLLGINNLPFIDLELSGKNIYHPSMVLDDVAISSSGILSDVIDTTIYAMAKIPLLETYGKITFSRQITLNVVGGFVDKHGNVLELITGGLAQGTIDRPNNADYLYLNISNNPATREEDINNVVAVSGEHLPEDNSFKKISKINGYKLEVKKEDLDIDTVTFDYILNSENIFSRDLCVDDTYINSSGSIGTGSSIPKTEYSMAIIPLEKMSRNISFLRNTLSGTIGGFIDSKKNVISVISGMAGVVSGTIKIPTSAVFFYMNISAERYSRESDKMNTTVVYGDVIPTSHLPQRNIKALNGYGIAHPYSGKKIIAIGDSITAYERTENGGQNTKSNYIIRACSKMGAFLVENYAIGGSTISQRASDPTGRNPIAVRYTEMDDDADLVIVAGGTNDCTHSWTTLGMFSDKTVNTFYGAMHVLCSGLKEKYVGKQIVFLTPIRRYAEFVNMITPDSPNANGETPVDYVDAIIEVCNYYGIPVLDMYRTFPLNPFFASYRNKYMTDGTHPNELGAIAMAEKLVNYLKNI